MLDPENPAAIRQEVAHICRSIALRCHCDPFEVIDDVVATLAATALRNAPITDPQKYLRRSARRAAYRKCCQTHKKWRQASFPDSEEQVEAINEQQLSPLDRLVEAEEREAVDRAIDQLGPDERQAVERFCRRSTSRMQKKDYYLKQQAVRKIRCVLERNGML